MTLMSEKWVIIYNELIRPQSRSIGPERNTFTMKLVTSDTYVTPTDESFRLSKNSYTAVFGVILGMIISLVALASKGNK